MKNLDTATPKLWNLGHAWQELYKKQNDFISEWREQSAKQAGETAQAIAELRKEFERQSHDLTNAIRAGRAETAQAIAELRGEFGRQSPDSYKAIGTAHSLSSKLAPSYPEVEVIGQREVEVISNLKSDQLTRLKELFRSDKYTATRADLLDVPNCVVDNFSGAIIYLDGKVEESCKPVAHYFIDVENAEKMRSLYASHEQHIHGRVFHAFHRATGAYGHFILDGLCTLALFSGEIKRQEMKVLVPPHIPSWGVSILAQLGFTEERLVRYLHPIRCHSLFYSNLIGTSNTYFPNPASLKMFREFVRAPPSRQNRRKVYLKRQNAYSPRYVLNEAEVQNQFTESGFECIDPAELSFSDQMQLFADAEVVAGSHGSAFVNIIFMQPKSHVIDLMPASWVGYWGDDGKQERWLLNLTSVCDLKYSLILSESSMTGPPRLPGGDHQLAKIESTIDLNVLRAVLSKL